MVKGASLVSAVLPSLEVIFTRTFSEFTSGMVQLNTPSFAVDDVIFSQVMLSVE